MTDSPVRHPVSDTAALVMLWASGYYQENPLIGSYLRRLDLSAGRDLLDCYNRICPWYAEVIVNRKHFIHTTVRKLVGRTRGKATIINLGAGFSPLALECADLLSPRCRFIEIDQSGMDRKHELYAGLVPDLDRFISCIGADITDTSSLQNCLGAEEPGHLIVVMEGLSYYVPREEMERVFSTLSGISPDLSIVFEHLKPCTSIREERRAIPGKIFAHVRDSIGLDRMTTYTETEIRSILSPGFTCRYYDMSVMEERRTGSCRYFATPDAGWLSCAVAVRGRGGRGSEDRDFPGVLRS